MKRIMLTMLLLSGCNAEFRYPCQDNENWKKPECKAPVCEINRDCPKYIFESQPEVMQILPSEQGAKK
jgi:hypothetical protein